VSERISRLRRLRLVINRDVTNTGETTSVASNTIPPSASLGSLAYFSHMPVPSSYIYTPPHPVLPWYYSVNVSDSTSQPHVPTTTSETSGARNVSTSSSSSFSICSSKTLPTGIGTAYGPKSLTHKRRRLSHYIAEPNVGRGYIKEIAFGVNGRIVASPFGYGVRLLSFDPDCSELCDRTQDFVKSPVQLHELSTNICHGSVVVSTKFSPDSSLIVTGSLSGKVGFHRPRW